MSDDQYLTQTQIGKRYGNMSAQKVGKWLQRVGLRNADGSPTAKAIDGGFCKEKYAGEERNIWFWIWHAAKTMPVLEESLQNPAAFAAAQKERAAKEQATEEVEMEDDEIEDEELKGGE